MAGGEGLRRTGARRAAGWTLLLLLALARPAGAAEGIDGLAALRRVYLEAVHREAAVAEGLRTVDSLRVALEVREGSRLDGLLTGYRGALTTLRAKHGVWPPARLRHLRGGLRLLDGAVAAHPDLAEVRYLRLMSCYYLPSLLGRGGSVREDFAALGRLLPGVREEYPPDLYRSIARFVLEHGALPEERRQALLDSLPAVDG